MFDIKAIRDDAQAFDAGLAKRGLEPQAARLVEIDERRRKIVTRLQEMQQRRNDASKLIGQAKAKKDEATAQKLMDEVAALKGDIQKGEEEERHVNAELEAALASIPNIPLDEVPVGPDESANVEHHRNGAPRAMNFAPREHADLGEALGLMDFETAAKLSGARFSVLKGALARLERAIGNFMVDLHTSEFGYEEVAPPLLVRDDAMFGTAQLPKFAEDQFEIFGDLRRLQLIYEKKHERLEEKRRANETLSMLNNMLGESMRKAKERNVDVSWVAPTFEQLRDTFNNYAESFSVFASEFQDLSQKFSNLHSQGTNHVWLIPTAEVPLTNLVRESILSEEELPKRFTAYTACFRSEAGSAGRDTRGMIRQHQFSKVELVSITTPEKSLEEHDRMLACAEEVLKRLGLHYRVMVLSTGDMGFAARKTYDIEVWLPGQNAYREISSCSVCGDFQARRMNARYRPKGEKGTPLRAHAERLGPRGRADACGGDGKLSAQADGSIEVPEALRPYMGGLEVIVPHGAPHG